MRGKEGGKGGQQCSASLAKFFLSGTQESCRLRRCGDRELRLWADLEAPSDPLLSTRQAHKVNGVEREVVCCVHTGGGQRAAGSWARAGRHSENRTRHDDDPIGNPTRFGPTRVREIEAMW